MSDQPKPATGEWTVESAEKIVGNIWNRGGIIELLVDAHNAALAAERDEYRKQALSNHTAQDAARSTIKHLQQQLAAEREKVQPLVDALTKTRDLIDSYNSTDKPAVDFLSNIEIIVYDALAKVKEGK